MREIDNFLSSFGTKEHCFQWFAESAEAKAKNFPAGFTHSNLDLLWRQLQENNRLGYGIYFAVNETDGRTRRKDSITAVRCLFLDLDGAPLEPVLLHPIKPHWVIETSPGKYHVYWLCDGMALNDFSKYQVALAKRFGGDATVKDLSRVARVPGYSNRKGEPFETHIYQQNDIPKYVAADLVRDLELDSYCTTEVAHKKLDLSDLIESPKGPSERHQTLLSTAGAMANFNCPDQAIYAALVALNDTFQPPMPKDRFEHEAWRLIQFVREREGPVLNLDLAPKEPEVQVEPCLPDALCMAAPDVIGNMVEAICKSAVFPQPALALQAALCAMATIKERNYVGYFKNQCNLYTLGLAPTGAGKNHALECFDKILGPIGLEHRILGRLVSVAGVSSALDKSGSIGVSIIDEAGLFFSALLASDKNGNSNKSELREILMSLFNAKRKVRGSEYSNRQGAVVRTDIIAPHLSIHAVSTAETFWRGIKSEHAIDGFVSRFLYFKPENPNPERNWDKQDFQLGEGVLQVLHEYTNRMNFNVQPHKLKLELAAERRFKEIVADYDAKARNTSSYAYRALCVRVAEYFDKLLVITAEKDYVSAVTFDWCHQVIEHCIRSFHFDVEHNTFETKTEELHKKLYALIKSQPGSSMLIQDFHAATMAITRMDKENALHSLKEAGIIKIGIHPEKGKACLIIAKELK